jgi:uncharacterized protein (DUF697 family)
VPFLRRQPQQSFRARSRASRRRFCSRRPPPEQYRSATRAANVCPQNRHRCSRTAPREAADARLLYNQALQRKEALRQVAEALTRRFARIAFGIGAIPIPVADLFLMAPLQMLLVAAVAGLFCREPNLETVTEYAVASGVVWAGGMLLREAFRQFIKLFPVPVLTNVVAGKVAAAGTYALGRSAQAYFFRGEVRSPAEFKEEGDGFASGLEPQNS